MQHVFVLGCKGIPSNYGGFETFVDKLTEYSEKMNICDRVQYHVACMGKEIEHFEYHKADCFTLPVPEIKAARAPYFDIIALRYVLKYLKLHPEIEHPIIYVLACRIGPFMGHYAKKIHKLGGVFFLNPDGHEWKRSKWSAPIRKYWKMSEKGMVKHADYVICDSRNIESYIRQEYGKYNPKTTFIAYGAEIGETKQKTDGEVKDSYGEWLSRNGLQSDEYYLIVGRFVPENNYETMIREFMASDSQRNLAIITTANDKLYRELNEKLHFETDARIRFLDPVYDQALLREIRVNAYGYLHGHEVGGTNPSLLEALGSTRLNLVLNVGFNHEVAEETAIYWNKEIGNLAGVIHDCDRLDEETIRKMDELSTERISRAYSWEFIVNRYTEEFLTGK